MNQKQDTVAGLHRYMSVREVLELTGWGRKTLYREVDAGRFPLPVRLSPGRIGFSVDKVRDWQGTRQPAA